MATVLVRIAELRDHVGTTVTVRGWTTHTRSSGKIAFIVARDGTGVLQAVLVRNDVPPDVWERFAALTQETSVTLTGTVRAEPRAPGGFELGLTNLEIIGPSPIDYPIQPKEHGVDFLMENRHLWLRSPRQVAILRVRAEIEQSIHDFFYARDFVRVDTPILTAAIGERSGLFSTEYFDLGTAYLAQTGQLYGEAAAAALGRIYTFGPTFRAEKSKTRRHLAEFWMIELLSAVVARCLDRCAEQFRELERDTTKLESVVAPFPRLSYAEALVRLQEKGRTVPWGDDLGAEDETLLVEGYDRPLFIYNYAKEAKAFYMKENPADPRTVLCDDCLAPEGYGEIIGGSQREDDYEKLKRRIVAEGLPVDAYQWYLDLRRFGTFPHAGFGLGLERTVAWICGISHVRETVPFARTMQRLTP
jgi:asparaginyl-tRNA synthetase